MKKNKTKWDWIYILRTKGLTINGTPLDIDKSFCLEKEEIDSDGLILWQTSEPQCDLFHATRDISFYVCHPSRRNWLENRERRN